MRSTAAALLGAPLTRHEKRVEENCPQLLPPSLSMRGSCGGLEGDRGRPRGLRAVGGGGLKSPGDITCFLCSGLVCIKYRQAAKP